MVWVTSAALLSCQKGPKKHQLQPPGLQYGQCHLIVDAEHGAAVLYELVGGQARVVGLGHGVGHCVTGDHGPGRGDPDIRYGGLMSNHQM